MKNFLLTMLFGITVLSANAEQITCKKGVLCMIQTPDNLSIENVIVTDKNELNIELIGDNKSTVVIESTIKTYASYSMIINTKSGAYPIDLTFMPNGKSLNILSDEPTYIGKK